MPHRFASQILTDSGGLRTRFAPSPTGFLHLGHVASALYVWGLAQKFGAQVILRMEDHDRQRSRAHFEASIIEDLKWLGLEWDRVYRQSDNEMRYHDALQQLKDHSYHCRCSRKEIEARAGAHHDELWYDGTCRAHDEGPNLRVRLDPIVQSFDDHILGPQDQTPAEQCGDLLLRDRDGHWTYNFAVVVDDIADAINLIIRGQDILSATGRQLQLRTLLGVDAKPHFFHHPLIWADETNKLSKRDQATSIAQWRSEGHSAPALLGKAAFQVGLIPREEAIEAKDLKELFA